MPWLARALTALLQDLDARANASGAGGDGSSLRGFYAKNQMQHYLARTIDTTEYLDCLRALVGAHWADSFPAELDAASKRIFKVFLRLPLPSWLAWALCAAAC